MPVSQDPSFVTLPQELRDMIYDLCLVYPVELAVLPSRRDRDDIATGSALRWPSAPLLAVSSMIRAQAAHAFYGKNRWMLSCRILTDEEPEIPLPALFWSHVRHVSVRFDCDVVDPTEMGRISRDLFTGQNASLTNIARTMVIHEERKKHLVEVWLKMCSALDIWNLQLVSLQMDFTHCYCPSGCCRMISDANVEALSWIRPSEPPEKTVSIATGLISEAEQAQMHMMGRKCKKCVDTPWKDRMTLEKLYCRDPLRSLLGVRGRN